jgi:four helix bundle protein
MELKINHFTQLNAWKKNHELVLMIYKISEEFPAKENFGITSQIRRAVCSITANIAEGYGRYHFNDKIRFYLIARGSSMEVQNFLIICKDLNYINEEEYNKLKITSFEGYKLICGIIKSTANQ